MDGRVIGERMRNEIEETMARRAAEYREETADFLRDLVRTPSLSGQEAAVAELLTVKARRTGLPDFRLDPVGNVLATIGDGTGRRMLFHSHMDVVPPGGMKDPFDGRITDGRALGVDGPVVHGRGTCDTKGSVCAMFMAARILRELRVPLRGSVTFASVVGEESGGSRGTLQLLQHGRWDTVIVGEPSDLRVALGHRGGAFCFLKVVGRSGHCAQPLSGVNALEKAFAVVNAIQSDLVPALKPHDQLGRTVFTFTNASVKPGFVSIIPDEAAIQFDVRFCPPHTAESLLSRIGELIAALRDKDPSLRAEVGTLGGVGIDGKEYREVIPSFYTSPDASEVRSLRRTIAKVIGRESQPIVWPFATDGAFFARTGCSVIGFGPGDPGLAHQDEEWVSVDAVWQAAQILVLTAMDILGDV
jgi:putative selenium metabolism hydrolase